MSHPREEKKSKGSFDFLLLAVPLQTSQNLCHISFPHFFRTSTAEQQPVIPARISFALIKRCFAVYFFRPLKEWLCGWKHDPRNGTVTQRKLPLVTDEQSGAPEIPKCINRCCLAGASFALGMPCLVRYIYCCVCRLLFGSVPLVEHFLRQNKSPFCLLNIKSSDVHPYSRIGLILEFGH